MTFTSIFVSFDRGSSSFFQLCETHLGAFGVLFKNAFVGFLPFLKNVLQAVISFSLGSLDQVSNLQTLLPKLDDALIIFCEDFTFSHLQLFQVSLLLRGESLLLASLRVNSLSQDTLLLVEVLKLLGELLVLSHVLFRLLYTHAIVLRNCVELGQAIPQLLKLINLLVAKLFGLFVFFLQLGKLFGEVG